MTTTLAPVVPSASDFYDASEYQGNIPASRSLVESMFSVRHVPWHEIGTIIPEALRSSDVETVLKTAGMDWTVSKRPIRAAGNMLGDGTPTWTDALETDQFFAIVRDDTEKVLGVVKKAYEPFQNAQALDLVNDMLVRGDVTIETAGVLAEGARIWVLANIPRDMTIEGDVHVPYVCISASHTGDGAVRADLTVMRAECQNSLRWVVGGQHLAKALDDAGIDPSGISTSWTHRHSKNVGMKARQAAEVLGLAHHFLDAFEVEVREMMAKTITEVEFDRIVADIFPTDSSMTDRVRGNVEKKRDLVHGLLESPADGGKFRGTAWGAFQAFSSFDLWGENVKGGEKDRPRRQIARLLDGSIEKRSTMVKERLLTV